MDWRKPRLDLDEIEKRKQRVRNAWSYQRVDRMPLYVSTTGTHQNPQEHPPEEVSSDLDKQFELAMRGMAHDYELFPDDYIPFVRGVIDTTYFVSEHFGCTLGANMRVCAHPFKSAEEVMAVRPRDPAESPRVRRTLEVLRFFAERTPPGIGICDFDALSPMCTASQLLETELYYLIQHDAPAVLQHLLGILEGYYVAYFRQVVAAVGGPDASYLVGGSRASRVASGLDRMPSIDGDWIWHPAPYKALIDCDVLAMMNRDYFMKYQFPYVARMCREFGGGVVHCCGPQPYAETRVDPERGLMGIHMCWECSNKDNAAIKEALAHKGVLIYFTLYGVTGLKERLEVYRQMADFFAPDVVCIPVFDFNLDQLSRADVLDFYQRATEIATRYASHMDWINA